MTIVAQHADGLLQSRDQGLTGVEDGLRVLDKQVRAGEEIMGAQPTVPAGKVTESLVIEATFGPLALFHLLSQRDVQVKCSFYYFKIARKKISLKVKKSLFW